MHENQPVTSRSAPLLITPASLWLTCWVIARADPRRVQELTGYPYCISGPQAQRVLGKGVPQRPMACTEHVGGNSSGPCVKACGEVFLSGCEALGVVWDRMATSQLPLPPPHYAGASAAAHTTTSSSFPGHFKLPSITRGWGHTYYWPVPLPPKYRLR